MRFFSLSKKQYNKQQAVGYVVYMMVGSYHAEDLPRKFHNFHLHYAELPEAQRKDCRSGYLPDGQT